jgi:hypothetical protein
MGNDTVPNSYVFYYKAYFIYYDNNFHTEDHDLFYDGQNREIEDSVTNDTVNVIHITYPGNAIALGGTETYNQLDTLVVTNGNVTWLADYDYFAPNVLNFSNLSVYSSYSNPAYSTTIANTIGGWLDVWISSVEGTNLTYLDFVSQNLPASVEEQCCQEPPGPRINFNWFTDSRGRVMKGTLPLHFNSYTSTTTTILYSYY